MKVAIDTLEFEVTKPRKDTIVMRITMRVPGNASMDSYVLGAERTAETKAALKAILAYIS